MRTMTPKQYAFLLDLARKNPDKFRALAYAYGYKVEFNYHPKKIENIMASLYRPKDGLSIADASAFISEMLEKNNDRERSYNGKKRGYS